MLFIATWMDLYGNVDLKAIPSGFGTWGYICHQFNSHSKMSPPFVLLCRLCLNYLSIKNWKTPSDLNKLRFVIQKKMFSFLPTLAVLYLDQKMHACAYVGMVENNDNIQKWSKSIWFIMYMRDSGNAHFKNLQFCS